MGTMKIEPQVKKLKYTGGKGSRKRLKAYAKPPYVENTDITEDDTE